MDERERQYREYLSLREHRHAEQKQSERGGERSGQEHVHADPEAKHTYGESEMRRIYREKSQREHMEAMREQRRQREMEAYLAARERNREAEEEPGRGRRRHAPKKETIEPGKGRSKKGQRSGHGRGSRAKNIVRIVSTAVLAIAVVVLGGGIMVFATLGSMQDVDVDKDNISINPEVATQLDNYTNIAVLGTDARIKEEDNARSDAIIVASINKETNEVKMFSVYRDTLLDVGDQGLDKITHAYFYGGAEQTLYALNKNLDLNIDKVVVINWKTVADTIDAVGGIEIDVQDSEIEELNKYIPETARNVDGPDDKITEAGRQTLNGVQAVTYSRIRKDAVTGDYRRNERMKIVFSGTFKKLKSSGYISMFHVTRKVLPEVGTNLSAAELMKMMLKFKSYDMTDSTTGFPYDVGSWTGMAGAGYAWYGPPVNLTNNVSKLHEQFFEQGGYTPTDTVQDISYRITELTGLY